MASSSQFALQEGGENSAPKVIWGTNIVITDIISSLKLFFTSYNESMGNSERNSPKYLNLIIQVWDLS